MSENSTERLESLKHLFNQSETSKETCSRIKTSTDYIFRIHHRIWDDQKHLLHMFVKLKKRMIDDYVISLNVQQNV